MMSTVVIFIGGVLVAISKQKGSTGCTGPFEAVIQAMASRLDTGFHRYDEDTHAELPCLRLYPVHPVHPVRISSSAICASSPTVTGLSGGRTRKRPTSPRFPPSARAVSSSTTPPQIRPWQ